ncbi:SH3 domain-containing protein [Dysgonomonas alginatilytica]|uniref:SH3 domain-containing protein n=1 Tax=Dysgonomonas alginatilytica TaxID=1605892 RepID=A0A2V3PHM2_9BACT|nr:SH3 domain-containing protein [Dysgonomonas alginatilytica]PXV58471.1 SH3 domain-containing protein [Dysgonomonas alginatilytica]
MKKYIVIVVILLIPLLVNASETYIVKTNSSLNIRSGPGSKYKSIGQLTNGQTIQVESIDGDWAKIESNDDAAYINRNYIEIASHQIAGSMANNDFTTLSMILMYLLIVLSIILCFMRMARIDDDPHEGPSMVYFACLYFVICFIEIALAFIIVNNYTIYKFDWVRQIDSLIIVGITSIIGFCMFVYLLYNQIVSFFYVLSDLEYNSSYFNFKLGLISSIVSIIAWVICDSFFKEYSIYVIVFYLISQLIQTIVIFYKTGSQWMYGIIISLLMIIAPISISLMFVPFLYVFLPLCIIFLFMMFFSGGGSRSSSNTEYYQCYHDGEGLTQDDTGNSDNYIDKLNGGNYKREGYGRYRKM